MARNKEETHFMTPTKKLRFRGDQQNRIDEILDEESRIKTTGGAAAAAAAATTTGAKQSDESSKDKRKKDEELPSFMDFFRVEMMRSYMLEHDEERYTARRQKIYAFIRIPRELERFMVYGIMQCADSFLYIHSFLPVRFALAVWGLLTRPIASCLGLRRRTQRLLTPAEICDLLKCIIWIACTLMLLSIDTNRVYHIIKSQSFIKLYIFYNMIEVGDRLLSAFGQDTIDSLFWTATEPKNAKRGDFGLITHILFVLFYVLVHSFLIMLQVTTLNVAVNSNNKGLLTIMISNNFVELKGSVFKKFDKNNLFQLTCSDVRERFHISVLLFIVMIQTMKEFDWSLTQFCVMLPDFFYVLFTEIIIDWIKHAFITRFNEIPECIYREYTTSLAYDMTQTRQKHAFSDHSDLVARRMGFIPFPLSVVLIKAIYSAVAFDNLAAFALSVLAYFFILGLRICLTICALGKACKLMKEHQDEKSNNSTPSSMTNVPPIGTATAANSTMGNSTANNGHLLMPGIATLPNTPIAHARIRTDTATSPTHPIQRSVTVDLTHSSSSSRLFPATISTMTTASTPKHNKMAAHAANDIELDVTHSLELGATALFSNSDVDLDDVCLNEHVLDNTNSATKFVEEELARSEPDLVLQQEQDELITAATAATTTSNAGTGGGLQERPRRIPKRTHKRSESEPSMQSIVGDAETQQT